MVTRLDIINYLIKARRYTSYLEIGMDNPAVHFQKVRCTEKESVDPYNLDSRYCTDWTQEKLKEYLPFLTYRMTSDQFFSAYPQKKYDVIFIDGLHLENQVDRDISNALKHLNPGGAVIVHDCLPTTPQSQSEENPTGDWVGTVWHSIVKYTLYTPCNVKVIDTDWGVGIIEYTDDTDFVVPERLDMDYAHFLLHRNELMHIYEWTQIPDIICVSDKSVHFYPERLQKITDILLHNMDILPDQGLANGKMGVVLYLYRLNKFVNDQYLGDVADKLLDTVTENIQKENILGSFTQGLSGTGWAINRLILDGCIQCTDKSILEDLDTVAIRILSIQSYNFDIIVGYLLYGTERINPSVKHIRGKTRTALIEAILLQLKYLLSFGKKYRFPVLLNDPKDFDITWYFPWLLWSLIRLKHLDATRSQSEKLISMLLPQVEFLQQNKGMHFCNRFFLYLVLLNGGYHVSFDMPPRMWEAPDNPFMKNGVAGLLFILKQLTSSCDFLELKQKLSFRLAEFESSVDPTGYRQGAITPANCFGLLEGIAGVGICNIY